MNVLLFLTPKKDVEFIYDDFSIRQAIEKMEYHKYSAIPILTRNGEYVGTLTEGDILWYLKSHHNLDLSNAEDINIMNISRKQDNKAVNAMTELKNLYELAINQNFVPVVDDANHFIGIVTRKKIMSYFKPDSI